MQHAASLQVRIGIHTGLVVVGEMGAGNAREPMAIVGETPNIAARLQEIAKPNTVILSAATHQLIEGYFHSQPLGAQSLKGVTAPVELYQVLGEGSAHSRFEATETRGLTPFVGREQGLGLLQERWEQAKEGHGQVVLLTGEAGIGKSRLVQTLKDRVAGEPYTYLQAACSPYHQNSALYPVIELLQRVLQFQQDDSPEEKLHKLETSIVGAHGRTPLHEIVPLLTSLLSLPLPDRYPPLTLTPQKQKEKTQHALLRWLLQAAERQPTLLVWEDLHWADPSSLELLGLLLDQVPTTRLLVLLTFRPEFLPPWTSRSHLTSFTLSRLSQKQAEAIIERVAGNNRLLAEVVQQVVMKTDGVPLFVEECTKTVMESVGAHGRAPLQTIAIPTTLQDSLMARLDRLGTTKEVAQLTATLGREFSYELLRAVSPWNEESLQQSLARLVQAELLYQRGVPPNVTYLFKHALLQDAAYQSLLKSTRRQYHQQTAHVLEERFGEIKETQPELLAHHYTEAGLIEQAISYWQKAGQRAVQRSANVEAIAHFNKGLELLKTLLDTPERAQQELTLQIVLGAALLVTRGHAAPEVEHAYTRARELCQQVGETPQLIPVLFGLWRFYIARPQLHTARELGGTLLGLAQRAHDPALAVIAHYALGFTCFLLGALPAARQHLEEGIALYTPDQRRAVVFRTGQDPGVACRTYAAWTLWLLGYPDQALARLHDTLVLAHELSHPYSLAFARTIAGMVSHWRRDVPAVHEHAEAAVALSTDQGFSFWMDMGTIMRGWALAMQGQGEEGMTQIRQGIAAWRTTGAAAFVPYFCTVLAEVCDHLGHTEDGLQTLAEAMAQVDKTGERVNEAELYRTKGQADAAKVVSCQFSVVSY